MKNTMGKMRTKEHPYEIWEAPGWTWLVLKKWQANDNKPFARWFCAVQSPYTYGSYELGDCYVKDIVTHARCTYR